MIPKNKYELKGYPAKYGLLEFGDIIKDGDEYYNPFNDKWMLVQNEFIGQEWDSDHSKPVRRKFIEDDEE